MLALPAHENSDGYAHSVNRNKWADRPRFTKGNPTRSHLLVHEPSVFAKRIGALIITGILLTIVAPVLADENNSAPIEELAIAPSDSAPPDTSTASESPSPTEAPIPSSSPSAQGSSSPSQSSDTPTASSSPSPRTPEPIANQGMRIDLPSILPVDPRALSRNLPAINISGPEFVLACMNSSNAIFDIYRKNAQDSNFNGEHLASGDFSQNLMITGTAAQVEAIINSFSGLRMVSLRGSISEAVATFAFVAVSQPVLNASICSRSVNTRTIIFRPLGIGLDLKKNGLTLKK
ncbi:unannotated protein [freshwater metagenome]|uniref:Unannotated protein n=1 Tax=freshwater metagenome TaxID=449393 RepID=A0A6J7NEK1_9ZZZZ